MVVLSVISVLLSIAYPVLMAMAVYYDAKIQKNQNALVWALIVGFFNLIGLLIYVIVRSKEKSKLVKCNNCDQLTSKNTGFCVYCNKPLFNEDENEDYKNKVKIFAILALVAFVLNSIVKVICNLNHVIIYNKFM